MGCRCESCSPADVAPTYSEQYRKSCEVRFVARLPSQDGRRAYLTKIEALRGNAARLELEQAAMDEFNKQRRRSE